MNIGALEKPIIQTMAKDLAKNILDSNDITVVTTLGMAGKLIAHLSGFKGEYVNYCEEVEDLTPVILTKVDFKKEEGLYLETLMFKDGQAKGIDYECTTTYIDYNVRFVAPTGVFENIVDEGAIIVNFN